MVQVKQIVEEIINDNKVAVFSKSYCCQYFVSLYLTRVLFTRHMVAYSVKAKKLLKDRKVEFICIELDQDGQKIYDHCYHKEEG